MFDQERESSPNEWKWRGWPTGVMQRASAVIATTRIHWAPRLAAGALEEDQGRSSQWPPGQRPERKTSADRAGRVRIGSGRRAKRQFAI